MANDQESMIGRRIKARRDELRMSQVDLATACQVPQARISEYESGTRELPRAVMDRLCKALKITTGILLAGITVQHTMTESERDAKCRELASAASSNVFAQVGLMIAMGCVAGCKPASKGAAVDLVASVTQEYDLAADKIQPILELIKSGL
jgi:transcriptional regulator with XRE-family HTH domain